MAGSPIPSASVILIIHNRFNESRGQGLFRSEKYRVSIPYRFNESVPATILTPVLVPFQFLIGSMKELRPLISISSWGVSIPYRFNESKK